MAGKIQEVIFYKKLKKHFAVQEPRRQKRLLPLSQIKSCLILFDASEEQKSLIIFSIIKTLEDSGINVCSVGYAPFKQSPHWCFEKTAYHYINKKHTSLTGFPKADFIDKILGENYDLLIDFLSEKTAPMCYLSALSKSRLKVARLRNQNDFLYKVYDLIIENPELNDREFFDEIRRVLRMLNNEKE